ncbi:hypothetical protein HDV05_006038 [Chytridiales sp. JEL 0842]|nr:hypothetical protein HDV05_006038 [Chytridiales sp. JEL 0842]
MAAGQWLSRCRSGYAVAEVDAGGVEEGGVYMRLISALRYLILVIANRVPDNMSTRGDVKLMPIALKCVFGLSICMGHLPTTQSDTTGDSSIQAAVRGPGRVPEFADLEEVSTTAGSAATVHRLLWSAGCHWKHVCVRFSAAQLLTLAPNERPWAVQQTRSVEKHQFLLQYFDELEAEVGADNPQLMRMRQLERDSYQQRFVERLAAVIQGAANVLDQRVPPLLLQPAKVQGGRDDLFGRAAEDAHLAGEGSEWGHADRRPLSRRAEGPDDELCDPSGGVPNVVHKAFRAPPVIGIGYGNYRWAKGQGSVPHKTLARTQAVEGATVIFFPELAGRQLEGVMHGMCGFISYHQNKVGTLSSRQVRTETIVSRPDNRHRGGPPHQAHSIASTIRATAILSHRIGSQTTTMLSQNTANTTDDLERSPPSSDSSKQQQHHGSASHQHHQTGSSPYYAYHHQLHQQRQSPISTPSGIAPSPTPSNTSQTSGRNRNLAMGYVEMLQRELKEDLNVFQQFLGIMTRFKNKQISPQMLSLEVKELFTSVGRPELFDGFEVFMPRGPTPQRTPRGVESASPRSDRQRSVNASPHHFHQPQQHQPVYQYSTIPNVTHFQPFPHPTPLYQPPPYLNPGYHPSHLLPQPFAGYGMYLPPPSPHPIVHPSMVLPPAVAAEGYRTSGMMMMGYYGDEVRSISGVSSLRSTPPPPPSSSSSSLLNPANGHAEDDKEEDEEEEEDFGEFGMVDELGVGERTPAASRRSPVRDEDGEEEVEKDEGQSVMDEECLKLRSAVGSVESLPSEREGRDVLDSGYDTVEYQHKPATSTEEAVDEGFIERVKARFRCAGQEGKLDEILNLVEQCQTTPSVYPCVLQKKEDLQILFGTENQDLLEEFRVYIPQASLTPSSGSKPRTPLKPFHPINSSSSSSQALDLDSLKKSVLSLQLEDTIAHTSSSVVLNVEQEGRWKRLTPSVAFEERSAMADEETALLTGAGAGAGLRFGSCEETGVDIDSPATGVVEESRVLVNRKVWAVLKGVGVVVGTAVVVSWLVVFVYCSLEPVSTSLLLTVLLTLSAHKQQVAAQSPYTAVSCLEPLQSTFQRCVQDALTTPLLSIAPNIETYCVQFQLDQPSYVNSCPNDAGFASVNNQRIQYCNAAVQAGGVGAPGAPGSVIPGTPGFPGSFPGQQPGAGFPGQQPGAGFPGQQPGFPGQQPGTGFPGQQPGAGFPGQQPGSGFPGQPGSPTLPGAGTFPTSGTNNPFATQSPRSSAHKYRASAFAGAAAAAAAAVFML